MTTNRSAAAALVAGSLAGLLTMALHPTGRDLVRNASTGASNALVTAVHGMALLAQPLLVAGTLALTLRLRARRDLATAAFVCFAFASVAVTIAAAASGFLAPAVLAGLQGADAPARTGMLDALRYTGLLNRAFARIGVLFVGAALLLWSAAMLAGRELPRALAAYGALAGAAMLGGVASGRLRLDVHGFGAVVLAQSVWMTWAAGALWRDRAAPGG